MASVRDILADFNEDQRDQKLHEFKQAVKAKLNEILANNAKIEALKAANAKIKADLAAMKEPEFTDLTLD